MTSTRREIVVAAAATAPAIMMAGLELANAAPNPAPRAPEEKFDFILAGAGHNNLTCGAYLAKAGYRILVLEAHQVIGGGCKTQEILLPGFKEDLCSSCHTVILKNPMLTQNELDLDQYGYELIHPDIVLHYPFLDGSSVTVFNQDLERTAGSVAHVSKKDAQTLRRAAAARAAISAQSTPSQIQQPSVPTNVAVQRVANYFKQLGDMTGYAAACEVWESPQMRAASMSGGRFFGPLGSDFGTGLQTFSMLDHMRGRPIPKGGSGMLTQALGRSIEAHDGIILTSKPVVQLIIEGGRCVGVECADGAHYRATKGVISSIHVKHLIEMAPRSLFDEVILDDVALMQPEIAMFQFHYAFKEPPLYRLATGGTIASNEASVMEDAASVFQLPIDNVRGEINIRDYPLQVCHPSIFDKTRVPAGYGLLKIEGCLPYALKEGPSYWDAIKEEIADRILARYMRYTTNLDKSKLLAKFLLSPIDIERMNPSMWRGGVHGFDNRSGNFVPYRMGVPGLYQTGACTDPGGSISGIPGRNTAQVVLQDQGNSIEEVIARAPKLSAHKASIS
jgi:phytoene dehydrogenase-like protein